MIDRGTDKRLAGNWRRIIAFVEQTHTRVDTIALSDGSRLRMTRMDSGDILLDKLAPREA